MDAREDEIERSRDQVTITLDRYGHLFPGNEHEAAGLLDPCAAAASKG
jgi:hypothetical protein